MKNKYKAGILAFFLGVIGGHKFYLGKKFQGIIYILLFWTTLPVIFGIIEGIILFTINKEKFDKKYNNSGTKISLKRKLACSSSLLVIIFLTFFFLIVIVGNQKPEESVKKKINTLEKNLNFDIKAEQKGNIVFVDIMTNIPLPVKVAVGINLQEQKPKAISIGTSKFVTLTDNPYPVIFDISREKLPTGKYNVEVDFYPKWGAKDGHKLAKKIKTRISASLPISLITSYGNVNERKEKDRLLKWVFENVIIGTSINVVQTKIGKYEVLEVLNRNPRIIKAYYYKKIDLTIFVNILKGEVATWRLGKQNSL